MKNDYVRSKWYYGITYLSNYELERILKKNTNVERYVLITHDRDTCFDGSCKVTHCHFIVSFGSACKINIVRDIFFDMHCNTYLEPLRIDSLPMNVKYMIHKGYSDKYQYHESDLVSNDIKFFGKFLGN